MPAARIARTKPHAQISWRMIANTAQHAGDGNVVDDRLEHGADRQAPPKTNLAHVAYTRAAR